MQPCEWRSHPSPPKACMLDAVSAALFMWPHRLNLGGTLHFTLRAWEYCLYCLWYKTVQVHKRSGLLVWLDDLLSFETELCIYVGQTFWISWTGRTVSPPPCPWYYTKISSLTIPIRHVDESPSSFLRVSKAREHSPPQVWMNMARTWSRMRYDNMLMLMRLDSSNRAQDISEVWQSLFCTRSSHHDIRVYFLLSSL